MGQLHGASPRQPGHLLKRGCRWAGARTQATQLTHACDRVRCEVMTNSPSLLMRFFSWAHREQRAAAANEKANIPGSGWPSRHAFAPSRSWSHHRLNASQPCTPLAQWVLCPAAPLPSCPAVPAPLTARFTASRISSSSQAAASRRSRMSTLVFTWSSSGGDGSSASGRRRQETSKPLNQRWQVVKGKHNRRRTAADSAAWHLRRTLLTFCPPAPELRANWMSTSSATAAEIGTACQHGAQL